MDLRRFVYGYEKHAHPAGSILVGNSISVGIVIGPDSVIQYHRVKPLTTLGTEPAEANFGM